MSASRLRNLAGELSALLLSDGPPGPDVKNTSRLSYYGRLEAFS